MKIKIMNIILLISLSISIFYNIRQINNIKQEESIVFNFTYSYIKNINRGLKELEKCYSKQDYRGLESIHSDVVENLFSLNQLLNDGVYLIDDKNFYIYGLHDFKDIGTAINGGLKGKGFQGSLIEDDILSENEIMFIRQLSKDLEILLATLVGKDGLNINPDLTIDVYTNALKNFSENWSLAYGRSPSGFSPYDYLKAK